MKRTLEDYFSSLPVDRRDLLMSLHELIVRLFPSATIDLQYKMPTYCAGQGWVAIANQEHYISL